LKGTFDSDSSLLCSLPRHLLVDELIILRVSFNNLDYFEVTSIQNTLTMSEKAKIKKIYPTFGFANSTEFKTSIKIEGEYLWEMEEARIGNYSRGV